MEGDKKLLEQMGVELNKLLQCLRTPSSCKEQYVDNALTMSLNSPPANAINGEPTNNIQSSGRNTKQPQTTKVLNCSLWITTIKCSKFLSSHNLNLDLGVGAAPALGNVENQRSLGIFPQQQFPPPTSKCIPNIYAMFRTN